MNNIKQGKRGFIKLILLIVIALIVLGFFGYNLRDIVGSPTVKDNLAYVWGFAVTLWDNFLKAPALCVWDKIVIGLVWNNLQELLNKVQ